MNLPYKSRINADVIIVEVKPANHNFCIKITGCFTAFFSGQPVCFLFFVESVAECCIERFIVLNPLVNVDGCESFFCVADDNLFDTCVDYHTLAH